MPPDGAHFEIFPDRAGEHRYRLVAENGEITGPSEGYTSDRDAERGIYAHIRNVMQAAGITADAWSLELANVRIDRVEA